MSSNHMSNEEDTHGGDSDYMKPDVKYNESSATYNNDREDNRNPPNNPNRRRDDNTTREPRPPIEYDSDNKRHVGTVAWFHRKKGFGRIVPGDKTDMDASAELPMDDSIFVHRSQIVDSSDRDPILLARELIEYSIGHEKDSDKIAAIHVTWVNKVPIARAENKIRDLREKHPAAGGMVTGRVKWFNDDRGYGFITLDDATLTDKEKDIFVHRMDIAQGSSLLQGERVECFVRINQQTDGNNMDSPMNNYGAKAVNVTGPNGRRTRGRRQDLNLNDYNPHTIYAGRCKWFDRRKGFGYIIVDGSSDEVIVRRREIVKSDDPMNELCLSEGERVEFYIEQDEANRPICTQVTGIGNTPVLGLKGVRQMTQRRSNNNNNNNNRRDNTRNRTWSPQNVNNNDRRRNNRGNSGRNRNNNNNNNNRNTARRNNNNNNSGGSTSRMARRTDNNRNDNRNDNRGDNRNDNRDDNRDSYDDFGYNDNRR